MQQYVALRDIVDDGRSSATTAGTKFTPTAGNSIAPASALPQSYAITACPAWACARHSARAASLG